MTEPAPPSMAATTAAAMQRRNNRLALYCLATVTLMVGMSYASVPLYRWFCEVTGFDGTPRRADAPTAEMRRDRQVTVRFEARVDSTLGWRVYPEQPTMRVDVGTQNIVAYRAQSREATGSTGFALFSVAPLKAAQYFSKVQCFCFNDQFLAAGQGIDMPVVFFVDPAFADDPGMAEVEQITLSYVFYPAQSPALDRAFDQLQKEATLPPAAASPAAALGLPGSADAVRGG